MPRSAPPRWSVSLALAAALVAAASLAGTAAMVAAIAAAALWIAARHDSPLGTCLPLVALALLAVAMVALLLFLAMLDRPIP